jgi:ectoine hydroxylase-related dioxygenase (phytanoyl-CoA dioxygenase family)
MTLPQAIIDAYDRDGAVLIEGAIDAAWLARVAAAIERDIENPGPHCHSYLPANGRGRFHGNLRVWQNDPDFRDYCLHSPLPGMAAELLRADKVNLFYDQLFVKEPGTTNPTPWHNDQPYWPVRGWQVMSFWLALDPVTKDSGRVEFVRGSHKWDRWFQPRQFGERHDQMEYERNPEFEPMPDIEADRARYDIIGWDMAPGDVVAFHALTVHGAGGNHRADVRRRGYTVRYTGDDATYDPRPGVAKGLDDPALAAGDPLGGAVFPVVWPAAAAARAGRDLDGYGPRP